MSITNHLLAGAIIGASLHQPELAILAAYASHFALDAIPHFGYKQAGKSYAENVKRAMKFKRTTVYIIFTIVSFIGIIAFLLGLHLYLALICGLFAVAPDGLSIFDYWFFERHHKKPLRISTWINPKFHSQIQIERGWGWITETAGFLGLGYLLINLVD